MKSHLFTRLAVLVLVSFWVPSPPAGRQIRKVQLEGLPITMALKKNNHMTDWPNDGVRIVAQAVPVDGKTIQELLLEAHVFPMWNRSP